VKKADLAPSSMLNVVVHVCGAPVPARGGGKGTGGKKREKKGRPPRSLSPLQRQKGEGRRGRKKRKKRKNPARVDSSFEFYRLPWFDGHIPQEGGEKRSERGKGGGEDLIL